jgi:hypothetical protein
VWVSVQPQVREVSKRHVIAFAVDVAVCRITAQHLCDFDIDQMRRVQGMSGVEEPAFHGFGGRGTQQCFEQCRSIDGDQ